MTLMMRPRVSAPTGMMIGSPVSMHLHAAHQAVGGVHGDGAHGVLAEVLRDLEHQVPLPVVDRRVGHLERVVDRGQLAGSNSTSTTGPMTWTIRPLFMMTRSSILPARIRRIACSVVAKAI